MIRGVFNKLPDFFVQAFRIVVDSWKFSMLLLYILRYDWPIFMISGSKELLRQELECTLLKPDCHSWWISKMQSGREGTLEERYAIKLCFKLGKYATETYGKLQGAFRPSCMILFLLFFYLPSIFFLFSFFLFLIRSIWSQRCACIPLKCL